MNLQGNPRMSQNHTHDLLGSNTAPLNPNNSYTNNPTNSAGLQDHTGHMMIIRPEKFTSIIQNWNIKFDSYSSGLAIDQFLYRIRTLARENFGEDFSVICRNLPIILSGKARDWYWRCHKQVDSIEWTSFCAALKSQICGRTLTLKRRLSQPLPEEELVEILVRNLRPECSILDRLSQPLPEEELVEILVRNLRPEIRHELLYVPVFTIPHLLDAAYGVKNPTNCSQGITILQRNTDKKSLPIVAPISHELALENEEYRDNLLCEDFLDFDDKSSAKTLGIRWNAKTDSFYFVSEKLKNKETFTKREVLSIIARLFDPLGWLSPVIVTAKILMQQLWLDKTGWDDSLKQLSLIKWRQFIRSYVYIDQINIPRWIRYTADSEIEFHGFCDSSELAYAAVLYARVKWGSEIHTSLLVSKSRVAPIKKLSLPRLELCGALLLAELINVFLPQMDVTNRPLYLWSDSTIVLAWLKKPSHTWTTFVANRVAKIQDIVGGCWRHVSTYDNPADLATRRVTPSELKDNALWWSGPSWLKDEDRLWSGSRTIPETNIEAKPLQFHVDRLAELDDMLERFSCLSRALHVIAYMFRFFHATHPASRGRIKYDTLRLTSNELHPFILSPTSWFAKLYIRFIHRLTLHGGPQLMLATIRLECWILKAKNVIKSCVRSCKECVLARRSKQVQIMAALPPERTTFSRPFANTGVDFAGPFDLKNFAGRGCRITKGYICLYVCFATKAIHLEAVSDLSTPDFLAALTRFVSRRGCPNRIYSDNGRNVVGAAKEIKANLRKSLAELKSEATLRYGHQSLEWHFIPADAPHMGGLWEAGVKNSIESCLNSRPLTPMSESHDDFAVLTPGHFLIGASLLSPAEPEELPIKTSLLNRWRRLKQVQQEFCRRWKSDYLKELHKRNKWQRPSVDLKLGDMVVLRQEPGWRLGRVIKLYSGSDGHVRVVDLRTATGVITRPIHKLVLLPLSQ
ncbi:uncharacterized protein LOC142235461 [Haematobia irritans]|uniref:uncharacterized protein LOC142235461 n=1 Tax=Haematobia irritans TaxID=7368 RepID=UPI003F4FCB02